MIRKNKQRNEVWKDITDSSIFLPEYSESTKELNRALKKLYGVDIKEDFDTLESIVNDNTSISVVRLNEIAKDLSEAERLVEEFLQYEYERESALLKVEQVSVTAEVMNKALGRIIGNNYTELKRLKGEMKKDKHNPEVVSSLRKEMNSIDNFILGYNNYKGAYDIARERGKRLDVNPLFTDYRGKREKIKEIKKEIYSLQQRCLGFDSIDDVKKEIKRLRKGTKRGYKECKRAEYYEGLIQLRNLNEEIKNIENNPKEYIKKKDEKKESPKANEAEYWNNRYPISDKIVYRARNGMIYDVRDFIQADNPILMEIVEQDRLDKGSLDDIAYNCMRCVQENIEYVSDPQLSNYSEEWLFPTETVQTGMGDCEDGTNLMISLMRNAGMPAYRVKNACGEVIERGHSWTIYLRETDDEWVILDWAYKATDRLIHKRELAKNRTDYTKLEFTFNDEHSWAQSSMEINKDYPRKKKYADLAQKDRKEDIKIEDELKRIASEAKEKDKENDIIEADESPYPSLPLYTISLGPPKNFRYFGMMNILSCKGDETNWDERFNNFCKEVKGIAINGERDYVYLEKLAYGIKKEIDNPSSLFPVESAKNAYNALNKAIESSNIAFT